MNAYRWLVAVLALTPLLFAQPISAEYTQVPKLGQKLPEFSLKTIDGKPFKSKDYAGKKPLIINFWATW